jgi:hypothetical protein
MRIASFISLCVTALLAAGLGGCPAQGLGTTAEIALLPAPLCAKPERNHSAKEPGRDAALGDGAKLAQACESPRCPPGNIPCNYQIRPNGCVAWRCCVGR